MIDISVVIPTHNRASILRRCLSALLDQTLDRARYEIIVVDDGSTDETPHLLTQSDGVHTFRLARNSGPAAARNVGVRGARGRHVLFLDDDVLLAPGVLAQHLAAHQEASGDHIAILGNAIWPSDEPMSPFMRYLIAGRVGGGPMYRLIPDRNEVSYHWFITRHVSVARTFMMQHGLFDEDFPYAYGEDTELAYRLQRQGLRIIYRPDIVVQHDHRHSYLQFKQLRRRAGMVAQLMAQKHPELADLSFLNVSGKSRVANWIRRRGTEVLLDPVLAWSDRRQLDHPWLASMYDWALDGHQLWALQDAVQQGNGGRPSQAGSAHCENA